MRNVDKIKNLKEQLSNAQRYAARLEAMCKRQDQELAEAQQGAAELQAAMDGVMMAAVLSLGEEVREVDGQDVVGWRLRLPAVDVRSLHARYQLHARRDQEEGGYVVSVVPRGRDETGGTG